MEVNAENNDVNCAVCSVLEYVWILDIQALRHLIVMVPAPAI